MAVQRPDVRQLADVPWDLLVIGGGITGAGVMLEAARRGLRVLLVEQRDFAWGTSSRSSKMVHGGLRYLAQGDLRLTRHSLLERERLLRELPELVVRQHYLFPVRKGTFPGRWALTAALWLYDLLAGIRDHRWLGREAVRQVAPDLDVPDLRGAMTYTDALTDDSRLVMRVLHEGCSHGGVAANYLRALSVEAGQGGQTVVLEEVDSAEQVTLGARHVVNATGAWADVLSGASARVRPQRGSHLFVARDRLPVKQCYTLLHPRDQRPVFVFPWEGQTCIGTTDIDHRGELSDEPHCTDTEIDYLLELVNHWFPDAALSRREIISTMAGVRPIIASGKGVNPSAERRDHAVWSRDGVVSVSGGKLTTFRLIALDALLATGLIDKAEHRRASGDKAPAFNRDNRCFGTLGQPLTPMPEGRVLTDTLRWVLENESVKHLDDLLLRRTRLGNLLPQGARELFPELKVLCEQLLGWSGARWESEESRYLGIYRQFYSAGVVADEALKQEAQRLSMA